MRILEAIKPIVRLFINDKKKQNFSKRIKCHRKTVTKDESNGPDRHVVHESYLAYTIFTTQITLF